MDRMSYFQIVKQRPELFKNPDGAEIELLLAPAEIEQAEQVVRDRLLENGEPSAWSRVGLSFEDQYLRVLRDAVRFPNGSLGTYIRTINARNGTPGVVILPVIGTEIVLLRHFRHAIRAWQWEIPRGFGEPNSSGEENARRELREEIGAEATRVIPLGNLFTDTGMNAEVIQLFMATIESTGSLEREAGISEVQRHPVDTVRRLIAEGSITDSFTIAAFARAAFSGLV